jgi:hypothetical protein
MFKFVYKEFDGPDELSKFLTEYVGENGALDGDVLLTQDGRKFTIFYQVEYEEPKSEKKSWFGFLYANIER